MIDYKKLKRELDDCYRPMYFFHDDPDGLCSFMLVYDYVGEGVGVPVKSAPCIDMKFLPKVKYYQPDKVFVLDIATINQDFLDEVKTRTVWVDHHEPLDRNKVIIFNPRIKQPDVYVPATYLCYKAVGGMDWVMMIGCVGDHYMPEEAEAFSKKYPDLFSDKDAKDIEKAKYDSKIGQLVNVFSFILKGKTSDVKKTIKVLTRIKTPYEILEQKTGSGKFVWKQYEKVNKVFMKLWASASKIKPKKGIVKYIYVADKMTFGADIAGRLTYKHPKCLVIVAREVDGEYRGSLRTKIHNLHEILPKALEGVRGHGGGHEKASGFVVKVDDFDQFLRNLEDLL